MLILHQRYHGDYVCTVGRVAMSGGDGMDSCMLGAYGHVLSCRAVNATTS
jgi:hypothetical protein